MYFLFIAHTTSKEATSCHHVNFKIREEVPCSHKDRLFDNNDTLGWLSKVAKARSMVEEECQPVFDVYKKTSACRVVCIPIFACALMGLSGG